MSITKYKASWLGRPEIDRVEIVRETGQFVYVTERHRVGKQSDWDAYFDTWAEAHACLLKRAEAVLKVAQSRIKVAESALSFISEMRDA